jgi:hypothetical protein
MKNEDKNAIGLDGRGRNTIAPYCDALFWYSERSHGTHGNGLVHYNNCCGSGNTCIPSYNPRLEPLHSLAKFDGDTR